MGLRIWVVIYQDGRQGRLGQLRRTRPKHQNRHGPVDFWPKIKPSRTNNELVQDKDTITRLSK